MTQCYIAEPEVQMRHDPILIQANMHPMVTNAVKTIALDRVFMQGSLDRYMCCYFYCSAGQPCQQWQERKNMASR